MPETEPLQAYLDRARMPEGHPLREALIESVRRHEEAADKIEAAVARIEKGGGERVTREQLAELGRYAGRMAWEHDGVLAHRHWLRTLVIAAAAFVGVALAGYGLGAMTAGTTQVVGGVRAAQDTCQKVNGGKLCWIPVWSKTPEEKGPGS